MAKFGGPGSQMRPDLGQAVLPNLQAASDSAVGFQLAPLAMVPGVSGRYRVLDWSAMAEKGQDQVRGSGMKPNSTFFTESEQTWGAIRYALRDFIDEDDIRNEGGDRGVIENSVIGLLTNQIVRAHEERVVTIANTITDTSSPVVKWGAATATTIRANLHTAIQAIVDGTYGTVIPNTIAMDYKVLHALLRAPEFVSMLGGAASMDQVYRKMVYGLLTEMGLTKVLVSHTGALGENVYIVHAPDSVQTLKTTFTSLASPVVASNIEVWTEEDGAKITWYNVQLEVDEILVHDAAGYRFTSVLT